MRFALQVVSTRNKLRLAAAGLKLAHSGVKQAKLRTAFHTVPWAHEHPLRLVQLSDLHIGWSTPDSLLQNVVDATRDAQPDVVVLTGDYVNHSLAGLERLTYLLNQLPGPKIGVLGNHDHWAGAAQVAEAMRRADVTVLRNQSTQLAQGLTIVGIDDGITGRDDVDRAFTGVPDGLPCVVLSHAPRVAPKIATVGAGIILSGHTHGGQVHVPKITPAAMRLLREPYQQGWYRLSDSSRLYVNAGLGHSRRGLRFGSKAAPEVAVFDLRGARSRPLG